MKICDIFKISKELSLELLAAELLSLLLITYGWALGKENVYYARYNYRLNCDLKIQKDHLLHRDGLYFSMSEKNVFPWRLGNYKF